MARKQGEPLWVYGVTTIHQQVLCVHVAEGGVGYEMVVQPMKNVFAHFASEKVFHLFKTSEYAPNSYHVLFVVLFVNNYKHYKILKKDEMYCSKFTEYLLSTNSFATSARTNLSVTSLCICKIMKWLSLP